MATAKEEKAVAAKAAENKKLATTAVLSKQGYPAGVQAAKDRAAAAAKAK